MKFTDGFWQVRPGVDPLYGREVYDLTVSGRGLVATVPTKVIADRGDTLNRPTLTVSLHSPHEGVIGVRIAHHTGGRVPQGFDLVGASECGEATLDGDEGRLVSGPITATECTPSGRASPRVARTRSACGSLGSRGISMAPTPLRDPRPRIVIVLLGMLRPPPYRCAESCGASPAP